MPKLHTSKVPQILQTAMTKINLKRLHADAVIPTYAHGPQEDAGMDLYAVEETRLFPMRPALVKTGLSLELPPGFEAQIRPRSGLSLKEGITVWNAPGTVDPSYRGEIGVILLWAVGWPFDLYAAPTYVVRPGDRIAQMVIAKYEPVAFELQEELSTSVRSSGGFGSTGK